MNTCTACSKDVEPTAYGRCPICGAVLRAGAAAAVDAVRERSRVSGPPDVASPAAANVSCCAFVVGLAALLVCVGLIYVGQKAHWSSDGPAMLYIMIGIAGSGFVALSCLGGAVFSRS